MKNKMMRIASVLLVAALITTCAISGTFAKYVTRVEGEDHARVAKWGIVLGVNANSTFATSYETDDETADKTAIPESVVSNNAILDETVQGEMDKVVAPGTSSTDVDADKLFATVKGTPEVAARYSIEGKISDIVLPAGTYTDYTQLIKNEDGEYGYSGKFTLDKDYSPVKWNLVITGKGKTFDVAKDLYDALSAYPELLAKAEDYGFTKEGCSFIDAVTILQKVTDNATYTQIVESALGNVVSGGSNFDLVADKEAGTFKLSYDFGPNKAMDYKFELAWAWAFENGEEIKDDEGNGTGIFEFDAADTYLGNWVAVVLGDEIEGFVAPTGANASYKIGATLTATAVQID